MSAISNEAKKYDSKTHIRPSQQSKKFAARDEIHDHVQIRRILKGPPKIDDERMLYSFEHFLFVIRVLHLFCSDYLVFV